MALLFSKYRVVDGVTRLGATFLNKVFKDLDFRISGLEERKKSEDVAVDEITRVGLARIDNIIVPMVNDLTTTLEEGADAVELLNNKVIELEGDIVSPAELALVSDAVALKASQTELDTKANQADLDTLQALVYAGL